MKYLEKVILTDEIHSEFKELCAKQKRSMRGQAALLIEQFVEAERSNGQTPVKK
jgi:hypothetical protein